MKLYPIAALLLALPFATAAQDDVHPELGAKYSLDMGLFFPERDIVIQAGVTGLRGVDFTGELGLEKHDQMFAIDFRWRFGEKWSLAAQYFDASAAASVFLDEDIEWKGLVFDDGTKVDASSDFALYRLFFGRSFAKTDRVDFGIGAGIHWLDMSAEIAGSVLVNNTVTFQRERVSASSPLPNIGVWYEHSLSPRWAIKARADWFAASIDEYDGRLVNFQAGINFAWFRHSGIGLAYNHFEFDAGVDNPKWQGSADLTFTGPYAFVNFFW